MHNFIITISLYLILSVPPAIAQEDGEQMPQQGYTTTILREPVFDAAHVLVETTMLNEWLNSNYPKLNPEQIKGVRERLYYLVDSRVKDIYLREARIFPKAPDLIFATLFSWAERLGVFGGSLVYNALIPSNLPQMAPIIKMPEGIGLDLKGDLFVIRSETGGWVVTVPYYFMIWIIKDFNATNSARTQFIGISTGTANDKSQVGHSQATLTLIFSPGADPKEFGSYWRRQFGISDSSEKVPLGVRDLVSQRSQDTSTMIYKELTIWIEKQGPFAVGYSGIDGAYQWNRPHFLDFLRALKTQSLSPTDKKLAPKKEPK